MINSVYDFCDRTLTIAPDYKFGLEISSLYYVYGIYCETLEIAKESYQSFLETLKDTFPYSFRMVRTVHKSIPDVACLTGLNYIRPKPWSDGSKIQQYYLNKTTTGNVERINKKLANGDLPTDIPEYWPDFARLSKIKSGNRIVIFSPYNYQVAIWELMENSRKLNIVKSRQLGITQIKISVFLHRACLNPAYTAAVFLKNKDDTTSIAWRNRQMVESLSQYITNLSDSTKYFKIKGGGDIHFMNAQKEGTRGLDSVSDTLFDEAAFVDGIESIVGASGASSAMVGNDATTTICSTPSTKYGWFYDQLADENPEGFDFDATCKAVVEKSLPPFFVWTGSNGVKKAIIHWRAHPIYGLRPDFVRERMVADGTNIEVANREYNLRFENSDITIFPFSDVAQCMVGSYELEADLNEVYYMGIDTASIGNDYTVAYVIKEFKIPNPAADPETGQTLNAYKVVDEYRRNRQIHKVDMMAIASLVRKWRPRAIGVETFDGVGEITAQKLIELFPDITVVKIKSRDEAKALQVSTLRTALEEERLIYPAGALANELTVYSLIHGKFCAPNSKNDDCVSAMLMSLTVAPFNVGDYRLINEIHGDDYVDIPTGSSSDASNQLIDVRGLVFA